MAAQAQGMVERRGAGLWLTHLFMITGVLIIFFPIWLAFVASTVTQPEIVSPPMPVWPVAISGKTTALRCFQV